MIAVRGTRASKLRPSRFSPPRLRDANGSIFHEEVKTQRNQTLSWFSFSADFPRSIGGVVDGDDTDTLDIVRLVGFSIQFTPNGAFIAISTFEE